MMHNKVHNNEVGVSVVEQPSTGHQSVPLSCVVVIRENDIVDNDRNAIDIKGLLFKKCTCLGMHLFRDGYKTREDKTGQDKCENKDPL